MKRMSFLLLFVGIVVLASGCSPLGCEARRLMLASTDPMRDAQRSLARGKREVVAIYGYTWILPGVPDNWAPHGGYTVRMIEGTSDMVVGEQCQRFNDAAYEYARAHNAVVVKAVR